MLKEKFGVKTITRAAVIAALYVVLTELSNVFGIAGNNVIQVRFSEALTVLPAFSFAAVPGLTIGCVVSNLLVGAMPLDVVFGSLATLIGAILTYKVCRTRFLAPVPPIAANTLIVPFVLRYAYCLPGTIPFFMLTVGIGEIISCGILGVILYSIIEKYRNSIFK